MRKFESIAFQGAVEIAQENTQSIINCFKNKKRDPNDLVLVSVKKKHLDKVKDFIRKLEFKESNRS